ncbi:MAG: amino acid permease [Desulfobacterales bacterium]|nr:amino acid permease [Desulfobacterales bacterium]
MRLKKNLTFVDAFCITVGAMLSSGLFILPAIAYAKTGPSVCIAYLLGAIITAIGTLCQAELSTAMPKAGGTYFYVTRTMGTAVGTIYGFITFLALALKSAFALMGMAIFANILIDVDIRLIAVALCFLFINLNIIGTKEAGKLQTILVIFILANLFIYVVNGMSYVKMNRFVNFMPNGFGEVISSAGLIFVSFGGLLKIASLAEEIKNPGRNLPIVMISGLIVTTLFYLMVIFVTVGIMDATQLKTSLTPISDGAKIIMGKWGEILLSIAAMIGFISTANAGIMGASRYPLALSRDDLIPPIFGKVSKKFQTPHIGIIFTGVCIVVAVFFNLDFIAKAASSILILSYIFVCLAVIILRESSLQNYQPSFKAPFYPWLPIIGICFDLILLIEIGRNIIIMCLILILAGLFIYWFYGRIRTEKEYALLHIIERISAKDFTTRSLESELKEIIRERDEIIGDRFDSIIENNIILDIEQELNLKEFFMVAAEAIAPHINMSKNEIFNALITRENENSTVLSPHIAIPHIIIEGEKKFDILIARCKKGVRFSQSNSKVHAIFILIGTKDERNFHLRALSSIAQIIHDVHFDEKWMNAKNKEALRDIVLLGKRKR